LETDKAVIEVPSSVDGTVSEIHIEEGEEIKVGQLILTVAATADDQEKSRPQPEEAEPEPKKETERVTEAQPEAKAESEPATAGEQKAPEKALVEEEVSQKAKAPREIAPAAPSVRRLARELGVDINHVRGSGPGGRISTDDVKNHVRQLNESERAGPAAIATTEVPTIPLPDFTKWGEVEREPMTSIRRTTARRLSQAWATIPHVTHFDSADITELEGLRKRYARNAEAAGGKLTVTAIIIKVVASALKLFPKFNASLDIANQEIIYKKYYHVGVAVDTEHGLLVPVIRNVDRKNIIELSVELTQISEKARSRKVTLEDLEGGSLTVTNLGGIGGTNFAPIINPPEVAILGVSRASMQPVFKDDGFEPRLIMPLSLSYDHRLIDGADAARFLRWIAQSIEQPFLLSLEG
jgi:pyruvate dehydrogenase E2 component (dihydrolipoamide acetyltransferase)